MNQAQYNLLRTLLDAGGWSRHHCDGRMLRPLLRRGEVEELFPGRAHAWIRVTEAGRAVLEEVRRG